MFAPWKKSNGKPRKCVKSRDTIFLTKVHIVKAMIFPVVMYGWESWTIKKADHWRIDAFKLWCWRRLLRFPWTARRPNQSILKEISPEYSLEELMLKLKLQYFGHKERHVSFGVSSRRSCRSLYNRGQDGWMALMIQWTWIWANSGRQWRTGKPGILQSMGSQRVGYT